MTFTEVNQEEWTEKKAQDVEKREIMQADIVFGAASDAARYHNIIFINSIPTE